MRERTLGAWLQAFGIAVPEALALLPFAGMTLDSRNVQPGQVFVALSGTQTDGSKFIADALAKGAVLVLAEQAGNAAHAVHDARVIAVADLRRKVSALAAAARGNVAATMRVFGVTGTNGKTTTSQLIAAALLRLSGPTLVLGTLGYGLYGALHAGRHTTPDAIALQNLFADAAENGVREVSMEVSSHGLDQGRVEAVHFDTAIFTNLTRDHLDYHGTMEAYGAAKRRLFLWPQLRCAVINADDAFGRALLADPEIHAERWAFSVRSDCGESLHDSRARGLVHAERIHYSSAGILAEVVTPWGRRLLQSPLLGEFNLSNLLAALTALCAAGFPLDAVAEVLGEVRPIAGRMERFGGERQPLVVIDYAHTPDALEKALMALRLHVTGRVAVVFGCGGDRDRGKRPEMGRIAERLANIVTLSNDNPRSEDPLAIANDIRAGMHQPQVPFIADREQAIRDTLAQLHVGDALLVAGKGHEAYMEIADQRLPFSDVDVVKTLLQQAHVQPLQGDAS